MFIAQRLVIFKFVSRSAAGPGRETKKNTTGCEDAQALDRPTLASPAKITCVIRWLNEQKTHI